MPVAAYLLINTETGMEEAVLKALGSVEGVRHAHIVTGLHDVICYVEGKDLTELKSRIIKGIRGIKGIQRTVSCLAIDVA